MSLQIGLSPDSAPAPVYATSLAAGCDLRSTANLAIAPGTVALVPTGLKFKIPSGYCGMVCSRSGLAFQHQVSVLNAPGIIDADYRGEIKVILFNHSTIRFEVNPGDRVAQLLFVPVAQAVFNKDDWDQTARGEGGFGSTGKC